MLKKIYFYTVNQSLFDTNKQKQSSRGVLLKGVLRNLTKFTGKQLYQRLFFNKVADLRPATLLKKRLWHRCFPMSFANFLRTPFLQNTSGWLLLYILYKCLHYISTLTHFYTTWKYHKTSGFFDIFREQRNRTLLKNELKYMRSFVWLGTICTIWKLSNFNYHSSMGVFYVF